MQGESGRPAMQGARGHVVLNTGRVVTEGLDADEEDNLGCPKAQALVPCQVSSENLNG